jgi:hypothetical protein
MAMPVEDVNLRMTEDESSILIVRKKSTATTCMEEVNILSSAPL